MKLKEVVRRNCGNCIHVCERRFNELDNETGFDNEHIKYNCGIDGSELVEYIYFYDGIVASPVLNITQIVCEEGKHEIKKD